MEDGNGEERKDLAVAEEVSTALILSKDHVGIVMKNIDTLTQGFKEWLVDGVDYTREIYGKDSKPALLDPGTFKMINFFQVRPRHRVLEHVLVTDEGRERVKYVVAAELLNPKTGFIVAEGVGSCSTDEVKYQYRWLTASKLKNEQGYSEEEIDRLPQREMRGRSGGKFKVYRIRNPELLDLDNTIVKMAAKRAEMDAALQLPGVGAVFTQDLGDQPAIRKQVESEAQVKKPEKLPTEEEPERAPGIGPPPKKVDVEAAPVERQRLPKGVASLEELEYIFLERIPGYGELVDLVPGSDGFILEHKQSFDEEIEALVDWMVSEMGGERLKRAGLYGRDWMVPLKKEGE